MFVVRFSAFSKEIIGKGLFWYSKVIKYHHLEWYHNSESIHTGVWSIYVAIYTCILNFWKLVILIYLKKIEVHSFENYNKEFISYLNFAVKGSMKIMTEYSFRYLQDVCNWRHNGI